MKGGSSSLFVLLRKEYKQAVERIYRNSHWFPNPFCAPQSGHCHVIPLQDIPQKFSSMQSWHMANPHLHLQQKGAALLQHEQSIAFAFSRFCLYDDFTVSVIYSLRFFPYKTIFSSHKK